MKVAILCGGQGTRLREETEFRPKPLVPVGGKPILWHIMKRFAHYGHSEFVLCLGYQGTMIKEYFLNYEAMNNDFTISLGKKSEIHFQGEHSEQDYQVTLCDTGQDTMTGSRVKQVEKYLDGDLCMVTYGDGLTDLNIRKLVEFHKSHGKLATVTAVRPRSRFGELHLEPGGKVSVFEEKPVLDGWISAGYFVFHKKVLDYLSDDRQCILETEPLMRLTRDGELVAFQHDGYFYPMDTYRDYLELNSIWATGNAPWKLGDADK